VARRVAHLSTTFRRSVVELGLPPRSPGFRAVFAALAALADAGEPGLADYETAFAPGRAFVRRVSGRNAWILYRFDDEHVFGLTTTHPLQERRDGARSVRLSNSSLMQNGERTPRLPP
jgi:hypothetical protein